MSTHERQAIRDAVITQIKGTAPWRTAAQDRVVPSRVPPAVQSTLPVIHVYASDEEVAPSSPTDPRELRRTLQLVVEVFAAGDLPGLDAALDALALEVETALDADLTLGGTAGDSVLSATEIGLTAAGNRPLGVVRMVYSVVYRTLPRLSPVGDTFDTADVKYRVKVDLPTADQANDLLTLSP